MSPTYEQNKKHIYNWIAKNPENARKWYENNRRKVYDISNGLRRFKTEAKRLRNIGIN